MQPYIFLQAPPDTSLTITSYVNKKNLWNTDINLNCTYCFLSNEEQRLFAQKEQKYLIRQVHEKIFYNITEPLFAIHMNSIM
jgi:sulfatase maturation enzyme AslB (radical SAM superfamily)